jgi:hypothetical protein
MTTGRNYTPTLTSLKAAQRSSGPGRSAVFKEEAGRVESSIERIRALSKGKRTDRVLVDLGTVGQGALQLGSAAGAALARSGHLRCLADGQRRNLCMHASAAVALGSDFLRVGWHRGAGVRTADAVPALSLGLAWLLGDRDKARLVDAEILALRLPAQTPWPLKVDGEEQADDALVRELDPPIEGPLGILGVLLGRAALIELLAARSRRGEALLDWAFSTYAEVYSRVISGLPERPHIVWYFDDFVAAPLQAVRESLLSRWRECLRQVGDRALTAMRCDETARAVLPELVKAGVQIVSPAGAPAASSAASLRDGLPDHVILHGVTDFDALLDALRGGRAQALIDVAADLAQLWPVIASPRTPLARRTPLAELAWAAGYLKTLDVGSSRARREVLADRKG